MVFLMRSRHFCGSRSAGSASWRVKRSAPHTTPDTHDEILTLPGPSSWGAVRSGAVCEILWCDESKGSHFGLG